MEAKAGCDAKYDILKFALSVMVVAIHAELWPMVLYPWLRIAVPLFFLMTSFFLFSKLKGRREDDQRGILKGFLRRNARLYFFWFVLLLPLTLYIRRTEYFAVGLGAGLWNFFRSLVFGSTFVASWYIPASVIGVGLVWYFAGKWKRGTMAAAALVIFGVVTLTSSYRSVFQAEQLPARILGWYEMLLGNPAVSFPAAVLWIFAGKCFAEQEGKQGKQVTELLFLLVSCCGLYLEWRFVRKLNGTFNNDSYFMLAPVCIGLFRCIQRLGNVEFRYSHCLRRASTVIYVTHGTLVYGISFVCRRLFNVDSGLPVFLAALSGSLLCYAVLEVLRRRIPFLKNAF